MFYFVERITHRNDRGKHEVTPLDKVDASFPA
jgi:hypothetical protein